MLKGNISKINGSAGNLLLAVDDVKTRLRALYATTAQVIDCCIGWSSLLNLYCVDTCLGIVVEIEGQEACVNL